MTAFTLLGVVLSGPAQAQLCSLSLSTGGALDLSADGMSLASDVGAGAAAVVLVTSLLTSHTVTVEAPQLIAYPGGYDPSGQTVEVRYNGLSGLAGVSQPYTQGQTQFATGILGIATALNMHNRVSNPDGFDAGTYSTLTIVTCS